ncbi:MAG TPA: hypothetical protein VG960_07940 [Caulobacteraceae bacterium]|nr:hypothetical protein [Caulobacteraceae bacterium]
MTRFLLGLAFLVGTVGAPAFGMDRAGLENAIRAQLQSDLRDADSAKIDVVRAERLGQIDFRFAPPAKGRIVCARVNAKNGMGGYVGYKLYAFVFFDGGRIGVIPNDSDLLVDGVTSECSLPADLPPSP